MKSLRKWATPLTIGSSVIVTVTGLMLFFHFAPGLTRAAHEWIGWIMAFAVLAHLAVNYRAFLMHFKRPIGVGIMGMSALVMGLSFFDLAPAGAVGGSPVPLIMGAIGTADIATVIVLSGHEQAEGLMLLNDAGIAAAGGQSVAQITGGDRDIQTGIIRALFSAPAQ